MQSRIVHYLAEVEVSVVGSILRLQTSPRYISNGVPLCLARLVGLQTYLCRA